MKGILNITGALGIICFLYAFAESISMLPSPFLVLRKHHQEEIRTGVIAAAQSQSFENSVSAAERVYVAERSFIRSATNKACFGLLVVSCVCLVAGIKWPQKPEANQTPEPTATAVTAAAEQPPRQP